MAASACMGLTLGTVSPDSTAVSNDITMATSPPLRPSVPGDKPWQRGLSFSICKAGAQMRREGSLGWVLHNPPATELGYAWPSKLPPPYPVPPSKNHQGIRALFSRLLLRHQGQAGPSVPLPLGRDSLEPLGSRNSSAVRNPL